VRKGAVTKKVEAVWKEIPEIQFFSTNAGKGNPRIYPIPSLKMKALTLAALCTIASQFFWLYNKTRTVSVTVFVQEGFLADRIISEVGTKIKNLALPEGFALKMAGEAETREESFGGFQTVIIVTVFLFTAVLTLLFKTFKSTIIVLSVIPLGMVGALSALWITGNSCPLSPSLD